MSQKLPSISSLNLFNRDKQRDHKPLPPNPPNNLFQFPSEFLPSSAYRNPYLTNSKSDPIINNIRKSSSSSSIDANPRPRKQPSNNSGAINQRNHVKAKNTHSQILVKCVELLHERSNPSNTPNLPGNWSERNNGPVKEKLSAAKELYTSLTNEEWIDVSILVKVTVISCLIKIFFRMSNPLL